MVIPLAFASPYFFWVSEIGWASVEHHLIASFQLLGLPNESRFILSTIGSNSKGMMTDNRLSEPTNIMVEASGVYA